VCSEMDDFKPETSCGTMTTSMSKFELMYTKKNRGVPKFGIWDLRNPICEITPIYIYIYDCFFYTRGHTIRKLGMCTVRNTYHSKNISSQA
jgi:hypothetical protein